MQALSLAALCVCAGTVNAQCVPEWLPTSPANTLQGEATTVLRQWADGPIVGVTTSTGSRLQKWNGEIWANLPINTGTDTNGAIRAIIDRGNGLVIGGDFTTVGNLTARYIARESTGGMVPMGTGLNGPVLTMESGTFSNLFVGGAFSAIGSGGWPLAMVARWDGASWVPVGNNTLNTTQPNSRVNDLHFDNGSRALFAAGRFTVTEAAVTGGGIARLSGTGTNARWIPLDNQGGINGEVKLLRQPDFATLIAAGSFSIAGGVPANNIARYNLNTFTWSAMGAGLPGPVLDLENIADNSALVASVDLGNGSSQLFTWNAVAASWESYSPPRSGSIVDIERTADGGIAAFGSLTSSGSSLALNIFRPQGDAPSISLQPEGGIICVGAEGQFNVTATGGGTLTYQWRRNGQPMAGQRNSRINVTPQSESENGDVFDCVIASPCGTVVSAQAVLQVVPAFSHPSCPIIPTCDSIDFNNDGLFPDDQDFIDFLNVFAGGPCSTGSNCGDIDHDNDGLFPDDNDIISFLCNLAGGACPWR